MIIYLGRPKEEAMARTLVVTGAASGIGLATTRLLREKGERVIACDLRSADVIADLATPDGRAVLVAEVARLSGGRIDAIIANAGGGPPQTSLSLNFFGAVATLDGLRPLLRDSVAPRAVAVSSVAALRSGRPDLVEACLAGDEAAAIALARKEIDATRGTNERLASKEGVQIALDVYGAAKRALQLWCRRAAVRPEWAGAGATLNVVALGFFDTPAAAYILSNPEARDATSRLVPLRGAYPGRPEEAAAILAWCVSAENSQMTGQVLYVDSGIECQARPERF
jgi:NAD(P)-dependent dehydrogenase (short-subunit alcohol dehydrogenase family)